MGTRETTETLEPPGPQTLDPKTLSDPQTLAQPETLAPMSQPQELGLGSGSGSEPDRSPAADATASAAISTVAVGDFVWGRIKGNSWPGRVCDPSEASDHANKAPRKDERSVLVAYFGDGSFGWSDPLQLKPFVEGFDEMTRSSSKSFRAAVNAAVGEIGKCLEAQLCCNCLSEVKRDELAKYSAKGGKISSFSVEEFVGLVGNVALDVSVVNLLEAAMLRSWVVAFERGVDVGHGRKKLAELVDKIDLDVLPIEGKEDGDGVLNGPEVSPGTGNKGRKRRSMAALIAQMDLDLVEVSDDEEENKDGVNGSAAGEVKEEEVGSGRRERKKSKYLSPPYTFLSGGLAKILVTQKSSEPRTPRSPRGLASGSSSAVVKCSIDGLHKEEESSVLFQVDGVDTGQVLSDFLATAANPLHLKRNRSAKAVRGFFAEFRSSLYSNGAKFDAYQKLFAESVGVEKKIVSNDVGHKSEESKKTEVKRGRKKKDIVNGKGATPVDKSEDGKKSEGKGGRKKKDSVNGEGETPVGKSEEGKKAGTKRGIKKDIVNGVGETPVDLSHQTAETAEHSEKKDEAATESTPVTLKSQAAPVSENGSSGRKRGRKKKAEANQSTAVKLGCGTVNKVELVRNGVEQAKGVEVANVKALGQSDIVGHSQAKQATLGQESKTGNDGPIINVPVNVGSNVTNGSGEGKPRQKKKSRNSASHEDPAALVLTFSPETTQPSKEDLVSAFSNYGPVIQSETELLKESCSAKVTFRKTSDAEKAFNDKVAALGLPVANYRIRYLTGNSSPSSQTSIPVPKPPLPYIRKSLERMISTLSGSALEKVVGTSEDLKPETRDNLVGEMQGLLMKVDKILTGPAADEPGPSRRTKRTHASACRAAGASRHVYVSDLEPGPVVHALIGTEEHEEVHDEVHEEVQEEDSIDEEDDSEELTESFPGGPEDPRILHSFKTHIAAEIWKRKERGVLKCINHASKISTWSLFSQVLNNTTLIFRGYIERSGLSPLIECSYRYVNKLAVSAFIERWQPETNSFHLPFGEMTITLDDVNCILGIPITGRSVSAEPVHFADAVTLLTETLGVRESVARQELLQSRGTSVRLEWLKSKFEGVHDGDTDERNRYAARAYLLFLLGCTLFADKTATRVRVVYLRLLIDLDAVSTVAWGAGALAYLYRQLGLATRSGVRQMAGYMTLIEAWIYEHFKLVRPHANINYTRDRPRVQRWIPRKDTGQTESHLQALRELIDSLHAEEVLWDPYESMRIHFPRSELIWYSGLLKCLDMIEPYYPERVLRQYGRIQTIPRDPSAAGTFRRGHVPNQYRVLYQYIDGMWETWQDHVLHQNNRSIHAIKPWETVPGYMEYFLKISHPFVHPPFLRSGHQDHGQSSHVGILTQRISTVLAIGHSVYDRGQEYMVAHPVGTYQAIESMIRTLEGSTSSGQVYQRRFGE